MTKIYKGKRLGPKEICCDVLVTVNDKPLWHKIRHSPTGYEWGYAGSGPADLALSILWDFLGEEPSRPLYMDFKDQFVAGWKDKWEITSAEIRRWIQLRIGAKNVTEKKTPYFELVELQGKIENLIKELEGEKGYYRFDIRYNLYEKIIKKLKILIEEEEIEKGGINRVNNENSYC